MSRRRDEEALPYLTPRVVEVGETKLPEYIEVFDELDENFIRPLYGYASVVELAGTITKVLAGRAETPALDEDVLDYSALEGCERLVLILVDALGYAAAVRCRELIEGARFVGCLTSTAPSTTATAGASICTGAPPLGHGVLGYRMYLERAGTIVSTLRFSPVYAAQRDALVDYGFDPASFIPCKTVFEALAEHGVRSLALLPREIAETAFTKATKRGAETLGYSTLADMMALLAEHAARGEHEFIFAYWPGLDETQHLRGVASFSAEAELALLAYAVKRILLPRLGPGVRVLIVSDHGQIDIEGDAYLDQDEELVRAMLMPPAGEARFLHLYPADNEAVERIFRQKYADDAVLVRRKEALRLDLFGEPSDSRFVTRVGELLAIVRSRRALVYRLKTGEEREPLRARHGSLTPEEMLVPLIIY